MHVAFEGKIFRRPR